MIALGILNIIVGITMFILSIRVGTESDKSMIQIVSIISFVIGVIIINGQ